MKIISIHLTAIYSICNYVLTIAIITMKREVEYTIHSLATPLFIYKYINTKTPLRTHHH